MKNTIKKIILIFVVLILTSLCFSVVSTAEETEYLDCTVIGHELETEWTTIIKATCKEEGLKIKRCIHSYKDSNGNEIKCNYYISALIPTDKTKHFPGEWIIDDNSSSPVCVVGLKSNRYCTICDLKIDEKIEYAPHKWEIDTWAPSACTINGYCKMFCVMCGEQTIFDELSPGFPNEFEGTVIDDGIASLILSKGHNFESMVLSEATHLTEGVLKYACLNCAYDYTAKIEKLKEHTYTKIVFEATCTVNSYECYKCACGSEKDKIEFADTALGHSYTENIISYPNCNTVGKKQLYCTTCHTYKYETIPTNDEHIDNDNNGYCDRCKVLFAYTEGYYHYTVKDEKATIIDIDNSISGDVVVPSTLGGYPVTAIGDEAFAESFNITSVVVPEGVTYIDEDAFALCYRMESVTLPESLETIENWVFGACLSLKEIVLPENVVSINDSAFDSCLSLEKIVVKNAEAAIDEYICYTTLLPKDIPTSEWVEKYITAYEAMMNGDENAETLMAELETHTTILENEVAVLPELTIYSHDPSTAKTYADENGIPFKNISELEEPHTCTYGEWFTETEPTVFSEGVSKRVCDCGKFETKPIAKLESAVTKDETTKIEVTYTEENFETEVELIVSEEEINANIAFGDEFENYKAYDISLVTDGEKVQPNGYVTVKLPIPEGFNTDSTVVYYVAPDGTKTKLDSKAENGYVIFETNHFSEYVLVDESSKIEPPHEHSYTSAVTKNPTCTEAGVKTFTCSCNDSYTESIPALGHKDTNGDYKCDNGCGYEYEKPAPEEPADKNCSHLCHKGGFMGFIWKIINFFNKLFKSKQICDCGAKHW